eukprot:Skav208763  [mRNA]  locus=scaffold4352:137851:140204:- [translate_table: standard]
MRLLERDREVRAGSRSRSPLRRVVLPGGRRSSSRSLSRRGPRSRPPGTKGMRRGPCFMAVWTVTPGRVTESRGALPRRRVYCSQQGNGHLGHCDYLVMYTF